MKKVILENLAYSGSSTSLPWQVGVGLLLLTAGGFLTFIVRHRKNH